jgi:hypothetical protein
MTTVGSALVEDQPIHAAAHQRAIGQHGHNWQQAMAKNSASERAKREYIWEPAVV